MVKVIDETTHNIGAVDKIFTSLVNVVQTMLVPLGVKSKIKTYELHFPPPDEKLTDEMRELHLVPERFWWGPMTLVTQRARVLMQEIERRPPSLLLDIGSGNSTALFAALGWKYGFKVFSLENHQRTIDYINHLMADHPGNDIVTIQKCSFVRSHYPTGKKYRWYNADLSKAGGKFDFVFIDGPMSTLVGRNGALPEIVRFLSPDHRIFIDDCRRPHETASIEEWKKYYPGLVVEMSPELNGLACVKIPDLHKVNNYTS